MRLGIVLEMALVAALLGAALACEHARGGVESIFFGLIFGLMGPGYRRWLALRRQLPAPPRVSLLLEAGACSGPFLEYPVPWWSLVLVLTANAILAIEAFRLDRAARTKLLDRIALLLVALPVSAAGVRLAHAQSVAWVPLALLAGLWVESLVPFAAMPSARLNGVALAFAVVGMATTYDWLGLTIRGERFDVGATGLLAMGFALLLGRDRGVALEPRPVFRRAVGIALAVAVLVNVLVLVAACVVSGPVVRVPVAPAEGAFGQKGHAASTSVARLGPVHSMEDRVLFEDSAPLALPNATSNDIAALGSGRYRFPEKFTVEWSASDSSDPLRNGRRYVVEGRTPIAFAPWVQALVALAIALGHASWRVGALSLRGPSSPALRFALVFALLASFLAGLAHGWDRIGINADSASYVRHSSIRPLLYPAWIDLFDRSADHAAAEPLVPDTSTWLLRTDPANRFLNVVRAQKLLTGFAIATLVWALSRVVNVWLLALATYWAFLTDLCHEGNAAIHFNVSSLVSEGVNHALVFFFLASVLAYMARPGWLRGVFVAGVLVLLNFNRPANVILCVALPFLWLFDGLTSSWRTATRRAAGVLLVFALPLAVQCMEIERKTGHARLHSFTGMNTICMAIQVATPDDLAAFEDRPELQKFVRACIVDNASLIAPAASYAAEAAHCLDRNIYENALPTFSRTVAVPANEDPFFFMNEVLVEVSKRILLRHKMDYARLVLINVSDLGDWGLECLCLLAGAAAIFMYRRDRAWPFLYLAFVFILPLVSMIPACLVAAPSGRYISQFGFIRPLAVPLFLAVVASGRSGPEVVKTVVPS